MSARQVLRWLADIVVSRARWLLVGALVLTLVGVAALPGLQVDAGHSGLVDADNIHQRRFDAFLRRFGSPSLLFVLVEGGDSALRHQLLDALAAKLPSSVQGKGGGCRAGAQANAPGCVRDVMVRLDLAPLRPYAPFFVPLATLRALADGVGSLTADLVPILRAANLAQLVRGVAQLLEAQSERAPATLSTAQAAQGRQVLGALAVSIDALAGRVRAGPAKPLLDASVVAKAQAALGGSAQSSGLDASGYLVSRDGTLHLAVVRPQDDSDDPDVVVSFVDYVDAVVREQVSKLGRVCTRQPARCAGGPLRARLTGMPALTAAEKKGLSRDLAMTTTLAIVGILALFVFGFRSVTQGLLGLAPLVVALVATLAFVRFTIGGLNMLTTAFIPTVLGLGIDFAVHLLSRFNEARRAGLSAEGAVRTSICGAGPAMVTGALTTAGAFLALTACDFKGFVHLGLITCVGLLFALLATLVVTASMLAWPRLSCLQRPPPAPYLGNAQWVARLVARHRGLVLCAGMLITALMIWRASKIPWSYNYLDLLPKDAPAVEAMRELAQRTEFSGEVAALTVRDAQVERGVVQALRRKPTVGRIEALSLLVPSQQPAKQDQLRRLLPLLQRARELPPLAKAVALDSLRESLQQLRDTLQDLRFTAKQAGRAEAEWFASPLAALDRLERAITQAKPEVARANLAGAQNEILGGLRGAVALLTQSVSAPLLDEHRLLTLLPESLRERLTRDGYHAVYVYPSRSLWSDGFLERFVAEVRDVDPDVTGFPVTYWETNLAIEGGFRRASLYAVLALCFLLLVDFRSLRYTVFALLPLGIGMAWMWGSMSLLGIRYNFANIIAFPLIIGIGVASSVHVLHRYKQEGERDIVPVIEHTGLAILLSAATTMVGFGSLSLASHRGAASLGQVLLIGVGACLATSTLLLPALLHVLGGKKKGA